MPLQAINHQRHLFCGAVCESAYCIRDQLIIYYLAGRNFIKFATYVQ